MCQTITSSSKKNIHSTVFRKLCTTFVKTSKLLFNHSEAFASFIKIRIRLPISCQISYLPNVECSLLQPKREKLHQTSRFYLHYDKSILLHMPRIPAFREKCSQFSPFPLHLILHVCAVSTTSTPLSLTVVSNASPSAFSKSY